MTATVDETTTTTRTASPTAPTTGPAGAAPDLDRLRDERFAAAAQRRAAARARDLTALLRERPDLAGVHAPADFAVDAVRWCA